ncbi:Endoribonuclease Dicer like 4 [Apostasia shenzhenica]|uniref:Endoribonuclease Dicer like 4 n=1 Tax=Apostasia shenzhenica TaxID=1088818 RepID=A0A2I0APR0_9ASPA|nr:Endoribonuclease Dicer like 4 [Apostasia shenzhenica]
MDSNAISSSSSPKKDPRIIARKYQLDLCKKATEENVIVYLATGCGKTHIAVLLMYEMGHLLRKPSSSICVFLAPTVPLVRQQATVIEKSTDFKVRYYVGNKKHLKDHVEWNTEIEQIEVLVMTPQILLHNLRHCYIRMELIALLIFDECHHAQAHTRHPYAQIMKEFYKPSTTNCPRIFGMTASPIVGKGRSNQLSYTKCINSLEKLLDAKVHSVNETFELEGVCASPDVKVYLFGPVKNSEASFKSSFCRKLDVIYYELTCMLREKNSDSVERRKEIKLLSRMHDNLIFCLKNIGLFGAVKAVQILSNSEGCNLTDGKIHSTLNYDRLCNQYLDMARSVLNFNIYNDDGVSDSFPLEKLKEPFYSQKLLLLINVLLTYRLKDNIRCIIFVKRIIVARLLAYILKSLKSLDFLRCDFLVGFHSGTRNMSRSQMNAIVEKFCSGKVNLLVATNVAEEGLDIQTCCLVIRFDLPQTIASFIQSRGRARMQQSEYVFLLERGNVQDEKLLDEFTSSEHIMNKVIVYRTSDDTFKNLDEAIYRVDSTGASVSTACSVSLLHQYCAKLPRDMYFTPKPTFFYVDDNDGIICKLLLPPNAPLRQIESLPCSSKDEAKRAACLRACIELHEKGALTDFLLPGLNSLKNDGSATQYFETKSTEDEILREDLHEMLVPAVLKGPLPSFVENIDLYFYFVRFTPIPDDRKYRPFGLFLKAPLPNEAIALKVDLHLARGRIVKSGFVYCGMVPFDNEEILLAQKFQEMSLKIILDRSEYFLDTIALGNCDASLSSTFYLLLPVMGKTCGESLAIDWITVKHCLSSPIFVPPTYSSRCLNEGNTLKLQHGPVKISDVLNSLVFVPNNRLFFFVDDILHGTNAFSKKGSGDASYAEYYKSKFGVELSYPEQPLLKVKQLFFLRNLLYNRIQESTETREMEEHFVEMPPELCSLKIIGFSKDIGSSLSLLPSLMHRLQNLLVAIELKHLLSESISEASGIRADIVLEALTTEKCMERFSLERFEVLGDAFLKYVVSRHSFLSYGGLDEGQLTKKRSNIVNNLNLWELAIRSNLQVYIRDELFEPSQYYAHGRYCAKVCSKDVESIIHCRQRKMKEDEPEIIDVKCTKGHHWLHRKTVADVFEALVGAFLVESGFVAAIAFLRWIGMQVDFHIPDVYRFLEESKKNISLHEVINVTAIEELTGYEFKNKGLLLQAFVHPSYSKHPGGCYQKLEFLGDAVLEYLITSYLYSVYPDLKPGHITDLRSVTVNNNTFAHLAVRWGFHRFLISDSKSLSDVVSKFENCRRLSESDGMFLEESKCPKVLGDIVESYIGAMFLDTGFNLVEVWKTMLVLLKPVLSFNCLNINPVRELRELCQHKNFCLALPDAVKEKVAYLVKVEVDADGKQLTCAAVNRNSKVARRVASQIALSKLRDLGYKHKNKSLEEILRSTQKKEPKLIGYNELPIEINSIHGVPFELGQETKLTLSCSGLQDVASSSPVYLPQQNPCLPEVGLVAEDGGHHYWIERQHKVVGNSFHSNNKSEYIDHMYRGGVSKRSLKSRLFEICVANYWNPPLFTCCKEEGSAHLKMFTFKVIVEVAGLTPTVLECHSEARPQKRAAEEHAAEGALWYLEYMGYMIKP